MGFHESFWLAVSAAAPVITLAAVVALPDTSVALRAAFALRSTAAIRGLEAELHKAEARVREAEAEARQGEAEAELRDLEAELRKAEPEKPEAVEGSAEFGKEASLAADSKPRRLVDQLRKMDFQPKDENLSRRDRRGSYKVRAGRLYESAMLNQRISLGNVIVQAGLLAVSLAALAYHRDVVPLWVAIALAVAGILLLAWTSVSEAFIRTQWKNLDSDPSNEHLPGAADPAR